MRYFVPEPDSSRWNTACIVGIGVNINQKEFHGDIKDKAISLSMVTGRKKEYIEKFYQEYIKEFENEYFSESNIVDEWKKHTRMIGKYITAKERPGQDDEKLVKVFVEDMTDQGYLKVKYEDGSLRDWHSRTLIDIDLDY